MVDDQQPRDFGSNAWVVEELYREYLADPSSVGESWHEFFSDYTPGGGRTPGGRGAPRNGGRGAAPASSATAQAPARTAPTQAAPADGQAQGDQGRGDQGRGDQGRGDQGRGDQGRADQGRAAQDGQLPAGATPLRGVASVIAENMNESRSMPTATSIRVVPAKLLEVNRQILNNQLARTRGGKVSFTHLIGWAVVQAMVELPAMTASYHEADGRGYVRRPEHYNLGLAVDVERKDGTRSLLVPNIKSADTMDFAEFYAAYEAVIRQIKTGKMDPDLFADTTVTLTNPGTVGTVGSVPRLMPGQSAIIGVGAIDFPAEYQATDPRTLAELGVGKVITVTSTYDHRVIQGAESGLFLKHMHELLIGDHGFYDDIFDSLRMPYEPVRWRRDDNPATTSGGDLQRAEKQISVQKLINGYRVRGHLIADLNPLALTFPRVHPELDPATYGLTIWDLDREFATGGFTGESSMTLGRILGVLRDAYCRTLGVEYMHIQEPEQKSWIQDHVEGVRDELKVEQQRHILSRLSDAEAFEKFLHTKYIGHKRFSLEGAESTIPMLDALLSAAADAGIGNAVMGMAHRGRLNVLANILGKSYERIFREFEGDIDPDSIQGSGDVKYHLGATGVHHSLSGARINVRLSANPSHLEAVDPVVEGMARALQDELKEAGGDSRHSAVLPILVHGDAAFAGQGVVAETLMMSQLPGYRTGGTVHLVINNQVGFTTAPDQARSSTYATDVAKVVQAPILHVNGDDPEACVRAMQLAFEFRQAFAKDIVVDLVCYRRWGHNEGDEPSYTQPVMYAAIDARRSVRKLYTEELVTRGDITLEEAEESLDEFRARLEQALQDTRESAPPKGALAGRRKIVGVLPPVETGVERPTLDRIVDAVTSWPDEFTPHPKLARMLERRRELLRKDAADWAMGESLAFGSLLLEGTPVRLAGQDSRRGTFSQRHSVLIDNVNASEHVPLNHLAPDQGPFMVYDSFLSEYAAMGFEYGYSVERPNALVMWEAQFGDFVNGGQIVIDQFMVAAEDKWGQTSGLVLLLPHGYEGQGPEHSSARIERFLTLCAEDNIQVVQPTSAAQYFHVLRRQVRREVVKPLVVITPKGLLRSQAASSPAADFESGCFREVLPEPSPPPAESVRRVVLCSGRVAYDLVKARDDRSAPVAVVRVEQLYPFPQEQIRGVLDDYPEATEVVWAQDEPENMGPWPFVHGRLHAVIKDRALRHASRVESASPASGSATIHEQEHRQLMDESFAGLD